MIEMNLKRISANRSVTHGRLSIPRFGFQCLTLELADGTGLQYKQNCCIPEGNYQMTGGFDQKSALYPVFRYKPVGFAKKPSLNLEVGDYLHLVTGDIALGVSKSSEFAIRQSEEMAETFREICREMFMAREIVVLTVYRSNHYAFEDISFETQMKDYHDLNFIEEEAYEQIELEHDAKQ
ncbi:MAG: hypothetical protein IKY01_13445 [Prevotella sp.]|nr:hypothetical protein [Prevotella sp.]